LRGEEWLDLVERVTRAQPAELDHLGFVLMMIRLASCASCNADSFRAQRGCPKCASQAVAHFRGKDQDLIDLFLNARREVEQYLGADCFS
jgi:hypothetical protein